MSSRKVFLLKCLDFGQRFFDLLLQAFGPILVILASILISFIIAIHFRVILPYYYGPSSTFPKDWFDEIPLEGDHYFSLGWIFHILISMFLSLNIAFNYFMVIFSSPGSTKGLLMDPQELEALKRESTPRKGEGFSRYCKICKKFKPPRSHHCHICKICVLRMDHHCPWLSNCVGFYNHKYFVLFLLYLWIGCIYVALMSFIPFRESMFNLKSPWIGISSRGIFMLSFVLTLTVSFAVGFLLCWHLYLIVSGQTTIEFYFNRYRIRQSRLKGEVWSNEYDLGWIQNFKIFFHPGRFWWITWLLPSVQAPMGDGIAFLTRREFISQEFTKLENIHLV